MTYKYIEEMRQRLGVEAADTTKDSMIEKMTPEGRLRLLCGWRLGDPSWASSFLDWAEDAGFKISNHET